MFAFHMKNQQQDSLRNVAIQKMEKIMSNIPKS